jgi:ketosteroid isomerase-like protein
MSRAADRAELLRRAVAATAAADAAGLAELFTADVVAGSPALEIGSLDELIAELEARDAVFGDLTVEFRAVDVIGDRAYAEWTATATHIDALAFDDVVVEATGAPLTVHGITVAEFSGDRISRLRQYWDEVELLDGLGLLPGD